MASTNLPQTAIAFSGSASGERLIPAFACLYPPAIDSHDLLRVDFDCHAVEHGALYLVEEIEAGKVVWMGCRRFDRLPEGAIVDVSGEGDWRSLDALPVHWRIAGEVKQIYKPSL